MESISLKWKRTVIELSSPAECDQLMTRVQDAKSILEDRQSGLHPPVVNRMGYVTRNAFYAFFEQEGLKTGSRGRGPGLFGMLASAACQNQLPSGLMYCTKCNKGVTTHCEVAGRYGGTDIANHSEYYQLNVAILKTAWKKLERVHGVGKGGVSSLGILVEQLNRHGK